MSKNNVNKEIKELKATSEIATTETGALKGEVENTKHVTREIYDSYVHAIMDTVKSETFAVIDRARLYVEMKERDVLNFDIDDKDGSKPVRFQSLESFSEAVIGKKLSSKQLTTYERIIHKFGVLNEDGTYTLSDNVRALGVEKLDILNRLPELKTKDDLEKVMALYGLTSNMSANKITLAIETAKGTDKKEDSKKSSEDETEKKNTATQLAETRKENKALNEKLEKTETVVSGYQNHIKSIFEIAQQNDYKEILEYYKLWKLTTK